MILEKVLESQSKQARKMLEKWLNKGSIRLDQPELKSTYDQAHPP